MKYVSQDREVIMNNLKVIPVPILPMGMVNAFLVLSHNGCILVDAGIPNSEDKVAKVLKKHNLSFRDINLIIITHAHADHAGSAYKLKQLCQAPILAHEGDLPYYLGEQKMTYCSTGWFGKLFLKTGVPTVDYNRFQPDILLNGDDTFDLSEFGLHGTVSSSPGHTAGSISVCLSNKQALVGDLVASGILLGGIVRKGTAMPPPFEDDAIKVANELSRFLEQGTETFYLGHGGPLSTSEVRRYVDKVLSRTANQQAM